MPNGYLKPEADIHKNRRWSHATTVEEIRAFVRSSSSSIGEMSDFTARLRGGLARSGTNRVDINFQLKQTGSAFNRFYVMEKLFKFCFYFDFIVMAGFHSRTDDALLVARNWLRGSLKSRRRRGLWPLSRGSCLTVESGIDFTVLSILLRKLSLPSVVILIVGLFGGVLSRIGSDSWSRCQ